MHVTRLLSQQFKSIQHRPSLHDSIYDVCIIGGGIIGLSCHRELLLRYPLLNTICIEKEDKLGQHQSTHNSGVIHAGIYYKQGSLRAKLCQIGTRKLYEYCDQYNIPYKKCGKLIVALNENEAKQIDVLYRRALDNGVHDVIIHESSAAINRVEPNISGIRALESPSTGIINFDSVVNSYAQNVHDMNGTIVTEFNVHNVEYINDDVHGKYIQIYDTLGHSIRARHVLCAGGLYSDKLADVFGSTNKTQIIPFRGVWLKMNKQYNNLIQRNIYPIPNPAFPFLGIHMTPRLDGSIYIGPNASLAFAREGYKFTSINLSELYNSLLHPGLRQMIYKHYKFGINEYLCELLPKQYTLPLLQQYCPSATWSMIDGVESGVRAQVMNNDGTLVEDFIIDQQNDHVVHLRNAPSPAATSSLAIAEIVIDRCVDAFQLSH